MAVNVPPLQTVMNLGTLDFPLKIKFLAKSLFANRHYYLVCFFATTLMDFAIFSNDLKYFLNLSSLLAENTN